jgi:hypothetical protein
MGTFYSSLIAAIVMRPMGKYSGIFWGKGEVKGASLGAGFAATTEVYSVAARNVVMARPGKGLRVIINSAY